MKRAELQTFSTRLAEDLIREVKVWSALEHITVQEITDQALRQWLERAAQKEEPGSARSA